MGRSFLHNSANLSVQNLCKVVVLRIVQVARRFSADFSCPGQGGMAERAVGTMLKVSLKLVHGERRVTKLCFKVGQ